MLSFIRVLNYAVIDEVELELEPGFSVMTGETGAGKSILVDALSLALGDRADASAVRHGTERAEISVGFDCPADHPALRWLEEHGLESEEQACLLRRVVGAEGRSRAFINNRPVSLQDLRDLGSLLVDIHGQHAHQSLLQPSVQRRILDAHGGHEALAQEVAEAFEAARALARELEALSRDGRERESQAALLRFQLAELDGLALGEGEFDALAAERGKLANVDKLAAGIGFALETLYEAETGSAHALLVAAGRELERLAELDSQLAAASSRLEAAQIELRDVASELGRYRERLEPDPNRLEWVETRLARIRALARRHEVTPDELDAVRARLVEQQSAMTAGAESLDALTRRADDAAARHRAKARELSAARSRSAASLAKRVSVQFGELGLPHGEFRVELEARPEDRADGTGFERIEFQVRLNPGQLFGPLSRVASGGELSRISLALEVVGVGATSVPTLVFDEVDAGIGGGVAEIVGRRLSQLAADRQVLCVTHLPQVASQGRRHYRVAKIADRKSTRTCVIALDADERVEELSRMLGGVQITDRARAHAAEMIDRAAK